MYMISCNNSKVSFCSYDCPVSVVNTCSWTDCPDLTVVLGHETFRRFWVVWLSHTLKQVNRGSMLAVLYIKTCICQFCFVLISVVPVSIFHFDSCHLACTIRPSPLCADVAENNLKHLGVNMWTWDIKCICNVVKTAVLLLFTVRHRHVCYILLFSSCFSPFVFAPIWLFCQ